MIQYLAAGGLALLPTLAFVITYWLTCHPRSRSCESESELFRSGVNR